MALLVLDRSVEDQLKADRAASGADRYDEVWEGVYMMAPLADLEHQDLQFDIAAALKSALGTPAPARIHTGANVSDREKGWEHNYRVPDVVIVFPGGAARNCGTHWCGGPDFCVEIASPGDRSRDKVGFYAQVGVHELLLIDRDPWAVELFRLSGRRLELVGRSDLAKPDIVSSNVVPVSFLLVATSARPAIQVAHHDGAQRWLV